MSFDLTKALKELQQKETKVEQFYTSLIKELKDKEVVSKLKGVRSDIREKIKLLQETLEYDEKRKKTPLAFIKVKPAEGIVMTPGTTNLLVTKEEEWFTSILSVLKSLEGHQIAYLALNNPTSALKLKFKAADMDLEKIKFVGVEDEDFTGKSEAATQQLSEICKDVLKAKKPIVILDDVTALATYNPPDTLVTFLRFIADKAGENKFAVIFVVVENGVQTPLIDSIKTFITSIIQVPKSPLV
ncbi:MAG: hypothetical protein ABH852_00290 [Methanobacteriota archaeon]